MNRFIASAAILLALGTAVAGCGNSGSRHGAGEHPVYGPGSTGNIAKGGQVQQPGGGGNGGGGGSVGTFSAGPALNQGRYDHTATTLSDGRVLVTGGGVSAGGGSVLKSTEIFDPVTNTWTDITASPGGLMTAANGFDTARQGHTAVLLQSGSVIIAGGTGAERNDQNGQPVAEQLKTAFSFNPATNAFSPIGDMLQNRGYHLSGLLPNGRAFVASGINQSQTASIAGGESFDPNANTWTNVAMGAHHTYGVAFTTVNNPTTVVGFGVELGMVQNQQGQQQFGIKAVPSVRTEKMDAQGTTFVAGPVTQGDRIFACANRISSSNALIAGGFDGTGALLDTTETFDPAANAFAAGPKLTNARQSAEMAEIGTTSDQIIVGGLDGQSAVMASCEVYGSANKVIIGTVDMQNARFLHKVAAIAGGRTLVIGGSTSSGQQLTETDSVEIHTR